MVEVNGKLMEVGKKALTPEQTLHIANDLVGNNVYAQKNLLEHESVVDLQTGLAYATNPGNLRLELADMQSGEPESGQSASASVANA